MSKKTFLTLLLIALWAVLFPCAVWSIGALHFTLLGERGPLTLCAGIFFAGLFLTSFWIKRALWVLAAAVAGVLIYFLCLTPEHCFKDVTWQTPWRRRPRAVFLEGNKIKFCDVRDFRYRSEKEMSIRYKEMVFSLEDLRSVDLAVSHWDGLETVAHTMLAFNFEKSPPLVLSMETRLPEGKKQSGLAGLFKQYEIIPVLGTPEDLFDLRIKHRGEDFYLYRTRTSPEQGRRMLQAVALYINRRPEFYNTLTRNCSTSLLPLVQVLELDPVDDIRLLLNGYSDQLMFRLGYLEHNEAESFASLRNRCYIPGKSRGRPKNAL